VIKTYLTSFFFCVAAGAASAAAVIFDDGNFGGSFDGEDLGTLGPGSYLVRGSNDGSCLSSNGTPSGSVDCQEVAAQDNLQSDFSFSIADGSLLKSVAIRADGFGPDTLSTLFYLELPQVPIFDSTGQQITSDLPFFATSMLIGGMEDFLAASNAGFLFPESEPEVPFPGPADFDFTIFSGNTVGSGDFGRFGVQWKVEMEIIAAPATVPLPAGIGLLLTGLGVLAIGRRFQRGA